jgi:hypothetical protein
MICYELLTQSTISGVSGMFEYQNAVVMGIDQVNTYHPFWTAGVVAGSLDGWTFTAGLDGTFSAVANAGGGQIEITIGAHSLVAGQIFALTSASVAGYRPPNPTVFVIQSVTATTVRVIATFTATATGTWTRGAFLKAGPSAAGKYTIAWTCTAQAASGTNKDYHFEPWQNVTAIDKSAGGQLMNSTGPQCCAGPRAFITVAAGDIITMMCANQTDVTDLTIVDFNLTLLRYASP